MNSKSAAQNILELEFLLSQECTPEQRGVGRTHAICEGAKRANGIVLCASQAHAKQVKEQYGVEATALDPVRLRGLKRSFWLDNFMVSNVFSDAYNVATAYLEALELLKRLKETVPKESESLAYAPSFKFEMERVEKFLEANK